MISATCRAGELVATTRAILVPGFMDRIEYASYTGLAKALSEPGIKAAPVDLFRDAQITAHGQYLRLMSGDIAAVHAAVQDTVTASLPQCALIGYCYGGNIALQVAAQGSHVFAVVAIMPTNFFLWAQRYDRERARSQAERQFVLPLGLDGSRGLGPFSIPSSVLDDARRHDVEVMLPRVRQPALFISGGWDDVIPPTAVENMFEICGSRQRTHSVIPGIRHDYRHLPDQVGAVNSTVVDWPVATHIASIQPEG